MVYLAEVLFRVGEDAIVTVELLHCRRHQRVRPHRWISMKKMRFSAQTLRPCLNDFKRFKILKHKRCFGCECGVIMDASVVLAYNTTA